MRIITRDTLKALAQKTGNPCLSFYLPTHRTGQEQEQDRKRFKQLLSTAENTLKQEHDFSPAAAAEFLQPVQDLLEDGVFWQHQSDGLAVFLSEDWCLPLSLPLAFREHVFVNDRFRITPLVKLLQNQQRFFILALSQKHARLLAASDADVHEVPLQDAREQRAALGLEKQDRSVQRHGPGPGDFHGHGALRDQKKEDLQKYLRVVDTELSSLLTGESAPLVFAGAEPLFGHFQGVCSYEHLHSEDLKGNPDDLSDAELQQRAWELIQPILAERQQAALEQFGDRQGQGQTAEDISSVLTAAAEGRVAMLFVQDGARQPGTYEPASQSVELHGEHEAGDEDLLDLAVAQTLLHDGTVHVLSAAQMPSDSPVSAALRY